jgi:116 kDa U5 small nuclear ribonucleoprotein component
VLQFVLEPLYKIFSVVLSEETEAFQRMLVAFGAKVKTSCLQKDVKPMLTDVCHAIFGQASGLTDMIVKHIRSPKRAAAEKVQRLYTGPPVWPPVLVCLHSASCSAVSGVQEPKLCMLLHVG